MTIYLFLSLVCYHTADFLTFQDCLVDLKRIYDHNNISKNKYTLSHTMLNILVWQQFTFANLSDMINNIIY